MANRYEKFSYQLSEEPVPVGNSTTFPAKALVAMLHVDKLLLIVDSSYNQAVTVQLVGYEASSPGSRTGEMAFGSTRSVAVGNVTAVRLGLAVNLVDYWAPFMGLSVITGATAPTTGRMSIRAVGRLWIPEYFTEGIQAPSPYVGAITPTAVFSNPVIPGR